MVFEWQSDNNQIQIIDLNLDMITTVEIDHLQIEESNNNYAIYNDKIENADAGIIIQNDQIHFSSNDNMKYNTVQMKQTLPIKLTIDNEEIVF